MAMTTYIYRWLLGEGSTHDHDHINLVVAHELNQMGREIELFTLVGSTSRACSSTIASIQ